MNIYEENLVKTKKQFQLRENKEYTDLENYLYMGKRFLEMEEKGDFDPIAQGFAIRQVNFAKKLVRKQEEGLSDKLLTQEVKNFLFAY